MHTTSSGTLPDTVSRVTSLLAGAMTVATLATVLTAVYPLAGDVAAAAAVRTITVIPVADGYVSAAAPAGAYGSAATIQAGARPGHVKRSYLRFRLPALNGRTIVRARLVLTRAEHPLGGELRLRRIRSDAWTESTLTYHNAPPVGRVLTSTHTDASMQKAVLRVPLAAFGGTSLSLALTSPARTNDLAFRSREVATGKPTLRLVVRSSADATCTVSDKLVPSCAFWWGIAPKAHTSTPRDVALAEDESEVQTTFTLMHTYHSNDELFPTPMERRIAFETGKQRLLLIDWKPATDMTWAAVARGRADSRIDRLAAYLRSTFPYPFFLTIWHEPEDDLIPTAGSGMTAGDYAAMFRHVVRRLRSDGARKPVIVLNYMGFDNYALTSWFPKLWPGRDVVDWIAIDPYGSGTSGVYKSGDFNKLVNRRIPGFRGYYTWATSHHPHKPIMLAEWGINEGTNDPYGKADYLDSVHRYLPYYPAIKSLAYFDEYLPYATTAGTTTSPDSSPQSLDAFRRLCDWAAVAGPTPAYSSGHVEAGA